MAKHCSPSVSPLEAPEVLFMAPAPCVSGDDDAVEGPKDSFDERDDLGCPWS